MACQAGPRGPGGNPGESLDIRIVGTTRLRAVSDTAAIPAAPARMSRLFQACPRRLLRECPVHLRQPRRPASLHSLASADMIDGWNDRY